MSTDPTMEGLSPEVATLLASARATEAAPAPSAALLAAMVEAVDSGHLDSAITPPRKKRMLGKLITAKALGIAGVIALTGGAAAAATGTLPDPVQDKASNVADVVGINIPNGDHGSQVAPVARDKDGDEGSWVELAPGKQWVQIDLSKEADIYALVVWHYHSQARVYRDVVVQVSDDPTFAKDVTTVYDNSAGGKDRPYIETYLGKLIDAKGVKGRYVRLYSEGNTTNKMNHYIEVEVFGKSAA